MGRSDFKQSRQVLEDVEANRIKWEKQIAQTVDWENPDDVAAARTERDRRKREDIIIALNDGLMKCPSCKKLVLHSERWVIKKDETLAVCRSCFSVGTGKGKNERPVNTRVRIFINPRRRYQYNGFQIQKLRENIPLSRQRFSEIAGWGIAYQQKIEENRYITLKYDTCETILQVFAQFNVATEDDLTIFGHESTREEDGPLEF